MSMPKAILLAAGFGSRLKPLTDIWPKCLMPIQGHPLLEYWIWNLSNVGITDFTINTHYLADEVNTFLNRPLFKSQIRIFHEDELLGTCGTLRANYHYLKDNDVIVVHADNWSHCDFASFIEHHFSHNLPISMMTFSTRQPEHCGIIEIDDKGIAQVMHEKVVNPPSNRANAAVYIFRACVLDWIISQTHAADISLDVLPNFMGRISTWHNDNIHRDIGSLAELKAAQHDNIYQKIPLTNDVWHSNFQYHQIHNLI